MQVPHEVRESPGRGRGIFATQDIKRGELVWKWSEGESVKLWRTEDEVRAHFASLARDKIQFWLSHVWAWDGAHPPAPRAPPPMPCPQKRHVSLTRTPSGTRRIYAGQLVQDQDDSHYLNHSKVSNNIGYHPVSAAAPSAPSFQA